MTKKILMISQNFYPEIGSAGNRMKNLYILLKRAGYDVTVLTTDPTYPNKKLYEDEKFWDDEFMNEQEKDIHRIQVMKQTNSKGALFRLFFYLEFAIKMVFFVLFTQEKYDVVYATSPAIFVGIVGLIAKYRFRCKFILEVRDLWPESLKGVGVFNSPIILYSFGKIETLLYKKSTKIVVNSEGFIDYISKKAHIPKEDILYIPNGARISEINHKVEKNDKFSVIYAGNIGLAQDSTLLMDLAKELYEQNIDLTVIGYGVRRKQFVEYVKGNRFDNVHFVKPKTRKETLELLSKHHIGIVTLNNQKVFETVLPGKVIDYMTCQVPIVASVSGVSKEIIEKEEIGFVSDSSNAQEMVKDIIKLKDNPNQQLHFAQNGKMYVYKNFLWEHNIIKLVSILGEMTMETVDPRRVEIQLK